MNYLSALQLLRYGFRYAIHCTFCNFCHRTGRGTVHREIQRSPPVRMVVPYATRLPFIRNGKDKLASELVQQKPSASRSKPGDFFLIVSNLAQSPRTGFHSVFRGHQ